MESFRATTRKEACKHCGTQVSVEPKNARVVNGIYVLYCPCCGRKMSRFVHIVPVHSAPDGTKIKVAKKTRKALREGKGVTATPVVPSSVKLTRSMKKKYKKALDHT
jgi:hypothetical protein